MPFPSRSTPHSTPLHPTQSTHTYHPSPPIGWNASQPTPSHNYPPQKRRTSDRPSKSGGSKPSGTKSSQSAVPRMRRATTRRFRDSCAPACGILAEHTRRDEARRAVCGEGVGLWSGWVYDAVMVVRVRDG